MSFRDILIGSLRNLAEIEKNARDVYKELYGELEDEELRGFLGELIKTEERHRGMVEEALRLLGEE